MSERIYINPDEDISAVIQKVTSHENQEVEVVVPSGARMLQNIVDAYLLRDATKEQNKTVTIITNDAMGKVFAERAGIQVEDATAAGEEEFFVSEAAARMSDIVPSKKKTAMREGKKKASSKKKSVKKSSSKKKKSKKKNSKKTKVKGKFLASYKKNRENSNGFNDLKKQRDKKKKKKRFKLSTGKIIIGVVFLAVIAAGAVFGKVLPKADVVIYPVREAASFNIEVLVDQNATAVDSDRGVIPAEVFVETAGASQEFSATGLQEVENEAHGTVTIYNAYSSSPQTFIPSRFQAESGEIFWTTENITVPGATIEEGETTPGTIEAELVAAEPGEEYNIGPSRFDMPALEGTERYGQVYAVSSEPMQGGKIGEAVVASENDIDNAIEVLRSSVVTQLQKVKEGLPENMTLWEEAYSEELSERTVSVEAGEPSEKFTAEITMTARGIAFRQDDLDRLLNDEISSRLSEDQTILPRSKEVTFLKPPVVDYQEGTVFTTLHVTVDVIDNIDTDSFRGAIQEKNKEEIKQILPSYSGIERVEVKLWPFWVNSVPNNEDRVSVSIFGM